MRIVQEGYNNPYAILIAMIHTMHELRIVDVYKTFVHVNEFDNLYDVRPYIKVVTYRKQ